MRRHLTQSVNDIPIRLSHMSPPRRIVVPGHPHHVNVARQWPRAMSDRFGRVEPNREPFNRTYWLPDQAERRISNLNDDAVEIGAHNSRHLSSLAANLLPESEQLRTLGQFLGMAAGDMVGLLSAMRSIPAMYPWREYVEEGA